MADLPPSSFCWFDYETFGISPIWDRPAQFAAIRTDANLEPLGEPITLYCQQADDYLPHPAACRVTGISPQEANSKGIPEYRFIQQVQGWLGAPGTCSVGYNSIRFDDEVSRHTLFRNLDEPYTHEWKDGASRWDLLDVVRLTRALRPDGIEWPSNPDTGRASNRLEDLAAANGLQSGRAHDALVDVRMTIALARLIRDRQPRLFAYLLAQRSKRALLPLLMPGHSVRERDPVILAGPGIPASRGHLALVVPLVAHPTNPNATIVLDLATDPGALLDLDAEQLASRLFNRDSAPGHASQDAERVGLYSIAANKCPVIVPYKALRDEDAERLGIDRAKQLHHRDVLDALLAASSQGAAHTASPDLSRTESSVAGSKKGALSLNVIQAAFQRPKPVGNTPPDVDGTLYDGGFLSDADRARLQRIRAMQPSELQGLIWEFDDTRLEEMVFRFRARNHPDSLSANERLRWREFVSGRLGAEGDRPWLTRTAFDQAMLEQPWTPQEDGLKAAIQAYADALTER